MEQIVGGGIGALSVNKLARQVGYTPGALYRYFASKEALVIELTAAVAAEIGQALRDAMGEVPAGRPLARVASAALAYRELSTTLPNRFALVSVFLAEPRTLVPSAQDAAPGREAVVAALTPIGAALREAAEQGALRPGDPLERTACLAAALHGVLLLRKQAQRAPEHLDVDRLYTLTLRTLLLGWGARAEDLAEFEGGDP